MEKITRMQILYPWMQWKPHSCILKHERQFWYKVQSMVLKIFICPSYIANWSLGLLESMGCDRHPIRALGSFHYQKYLHMINKCHSIWKWATQKTRFRHNSCMGNIYKLKAERFKGDPYIGVCFQALETVECLLMIRDRADYCTD